MKYEKIMAQLASTNRRLRFMESEIKVRTTERTAKKFNHDDNEWPAIQPTKQPGQRAGLEEKQQTRRAGTHNDRQKISEREAG